MGSGSSRKNKFKLPWNSNSKAKNKHNQLDSTECRLTKYSPSGEEDTFYDSRNNRKQNLNSDMDIKDDVCDNNNAKDSKATKVLEVSTKHHEGEVCNQLTDTADNMDSAHEKKDIRQSDDSCFDICEKQSAVADTCNTINENRYEEPSTENDDTSTHSNLNEVNIKRTLDVKTGERGVLENGQICEKVDDSVSNRGVEFTKPRVTDSTDDGATIVETYKTESVEHSLINKENKLSNIEQTKSDDVPTESPSGATSSTSEQVQSLPPNSNGNTDTSSDGAIVKPTNEEDKNVSEASDKTDKHKQTSTGYILDENLKFYRNELYSKPFPGAKIEDMLEWKGDYIRLERTHSYIQWLFPIPESRGMNYSAQPLQDHEAQAIIEDETLRTRVLEAFKMMLDFYGMELDQQDQETVTIKRGDNWKERYEHLNRSMHNHFRITRIIKALGELGWKHLQMPWLEFIVHEAIINKVLPKLSDPSTLCHFIDALKEDEDKGKMYHLLADLNDPSHKNATEVDKNSDKKGAANSSDKVGEESEENCDTDNKGKGSVENTKDSSENDGKEEKPNEGKDNRNSVISKEDIINDNSSKEKGKGSDKNNSRDMVNEISENKNVVEERKVIESKENANHKATVEESNELGKGNEKHDGADKDEGVVSNGKDKPQSTEGNKDVADCKFKDGEGNTTQDDADQSNKVVQELDKYSNENRDTENTENEPVTNVDESSIVGTKSKVTTV